MEHTLPKSRSLINSLDLFFWSTQEQMRLIRGYAFEKFRARDFIFRKHNTLDPTEVLGPPVLSCMTLFAKTLLDLNLKTTHCRTLCHNLDAILLPFPNLGELSMVWFDFDLTDSVPLPITTRLEKLTLHIQSREPAFVGLLASMALSQGSF